MKKSTNATGSKAKTTAKMKQIDWKCAETIGIDLGDRFSHYCALDADGAVVGEGRVATTPGAIELLFKTSRKRIAIEAGTHSPWMSRLLARLGHEVIVANSRKLCSRRELRSAGHAGADRCRTREVYEPLHNAGEQPAAA